MTAYRSLFAEFHGPWQNSQGAGLARVNFMNNGRYDSGLAASATIGILERTSSSMSDGSCSLNGDVLTITPDRLGLLQGKDDLLLGKRRFLHDNYILS